MSYYQKQHRYSGIADQLRLPLKTWRDSIVHVNAQGSYFFPALKKSFLDSFQRVGYGFYRLEDEFDRPRVFSELATDDWDTFVSVFFACDWVRLAARHDHAIAPHVAIRIFGAFAEVCYFVSWLDESRDRLLWALETVETLFFLENEDVDLLYVPLLFKGLLAVKRNLFFEKGRLWVVREGRGRGFS